MDFSIEVNPIGTLQELCVARHHPIPIYTSFVNDLNEQDPMFKVECLVLPYSSSGTASSKREAKKKAAYEMYKQIETLTSEDVSLHQDPFHNIVSLLREESVTLLKYYFGSTDAPKTPHLQSIKKKSNGSKLTAVDTMKIISERENFTTICIVTSRNSDGVTVMIQANILPLIVFSAIRKNKNDAKEAAAHFFLSCLKLKLRI